MEWILRKGEMKQAKLTKFSDIPQYTREPGQMPLTVPFDYIESKH